MCGCEYHDNYIMDLEHENEDYRKDLASVRDELEELENRYYELKDEIESAYYERDEAQREAQYAEQALADAEAEIASLEPPIDGDWQAMVDWAQEYEKAEALGLELPSMTKLFDIIYSVMDAVTPTKTKEENEDGNAESGRLDCQPIQEARMDDDGQPGIQSR